MIKLPSKPCAIMFTPYLILYLALAPHRLPAQEVTRHDVRPTLAASPPRSQVPDTVTLKVVGLDVLWPEFLEVGFRSAFVPYVDRFVPTRARPSQSGTGIALASVSAAGQPLVGLTVHFELAAGAEIEFSSGSSSVDAVTDANGVALATFEGLEAGWSLIRASVAESGISSQSPIEIVDELLEDLLDRYVAGPLNADNATGDATPVSTFSFELAPGDEQFGELDPDTGAFLPGAAGDVDVFVDYRIDGQVVRTGPFTFPIVDSSVAPDATIEDGLDQLLEVIDRLEIAPARGQDPESQARAFELLRERAALAAHSLQPLTALYFAGQSGLESTDIDDPLAPVAIGAMTASDSLQGMDVRGTLAALALGSSGIELVDITEPTAPVSIEVLDTPGFAHDVAFVANTPFLIVADDNAGVHLVDARLPAAILSTLPTAGPAQDVFGGTLGLLAVAMGSAGVTFFEAADPDLPASIATVDTPGDARHICGDTRFAFVSDGTAGVQVLDMASLLGVDATATLEIVGTLPTAGEAEAAVVVPEVALFVSDSAGLVHAAELSTAGVPTIVETTATTGTPGDIAFFGQHVFVASGAGGVDVLDAIAASDGSLKTSGLATTYETSDSVTAVSVRSKISGLPDALSFVTGAMEAPGEDRVTGIELAALIAGIIAAVAAVAAIAAWAYDKISAAGVVPLCQDITSPATFHTSYSPNCNHAEIKGDGALTVSDNAGVLMVGLINGPNSMTVDQNSDTIIVKINAGTMRIKKNDDTLLLDQNTGSLTIDSNDDTIIIQRNDGTITINGNADEILIKLNTSSGHIIVNGNTDNVMIKRSLGTIDVNGNGDDIYVDDLCEGVMTIDANSDDIRVYDNWGTVTVNGNSDWVTVYKNRLGTVNVNANGNRVYLPKARVGWWSPVANPLFGTVSAGADTDGDGCPDGPGTIYCNQ